MSRVVALALALRERQADEPPVPRVVRPEERRRRLAVERERPLAPLEAAVGRPAPEGEAAARGVLRPGQREAAAEQGVAHRQGLRLRLRLVEAVTGAGRVMTEAARAEPAGRAGESARTRDTGPIAARHKARARPRPGPRSGAAPDGAPAPSAWPASVPCMPGVRGAARRPAMPSSACSATVRPKCASHAAGIGSSLVIVPHRHRVGNRRSARVREHHLERLVALVMAVVDDVHPHVRRRLARLELCEQPREHVVLPAARRHRHRVAAPSPSTRTVCGCGAESRMGELHEREVRVELRALPRALGLRHVVDGERRPHRHVVVGHLDRGHRRRPAAVARAGAEHHAHPARRARRRRRVASAPSGSPR